MNQEEDDEEVEGSNELPDGEEAADEQMTEQKKRKEYGDGGKKHRERKPYADNAGGKFSDENYAGGKERTQCQTDRRK